MEFRIKISSAKFPFIVLATKKYFPVMSPSDIFGCQKIQYTDKYKNCYREYFHVGKKSCVPNIDTEKQNVLAILWFN